MGNVLAICETNGATLRTNALSAITLARKAAEMHGGDVVLLLAGKGVSAAAEDACKYAAKVVVVEDDGLEHYMAETYAPVIKNVAAAEGASLVCATATAIGKDVMPRVAALMEAAWRRISLISRARTHSSGPPWLAMRSPSLRFLLIPSA